MKVLFLGEFSGVFTELIPALHDRGIETFLVSSGDGFKGYKADFSTRYEIKDRSGLARILKKIFISVPGLLGITDFLKMWPALKEKLKGYDAVQLNNDYPLNFGWSIMLYVLHYVFKHNGKIYLSAWGDDYVIDRYECRNNCHMFRFMSGLQKRIYLLKLFMKRAAINRYVLKHVKAICPGTYHYKQAYTGNQKTIDRIFPFAISRDRIGSPMHINPDEPIVIFHGWQVGREKSKGNDVFDRVIRRVVDKYSSKVRYLVVQNVPYEEYCRLFSEAHIFIDQLYADDKGMNGLLGMAAGKVVFSGFTPEALASYPYYKGNIIGVNSYNDDEEHLFGKFCELIENPDMMEEISRNAIDFVLHNHLNSVVAEQYINLWTYGKGSK